VSIQAVKWRHNSVHPSHNRRMLARDLLWHTQKRRCFSISLTHSAAGGRRGRCDHERVSYYPRVPLQGSALDHVALQVQLHAVIPVDGARAGLRTQGG
jgi:hypothetical protein